MLKKLFSSRTRIELISFFLENPEESFFVRELSRKIGSQINSVRRELENLKSIDFLLSKSKDNKKYYAVNPDFVFYAELDSIFKKAHSLESSLGDELSKLGGVSLVFLTGSFVGDNKAPIDLLVIGDLPSSKLQNFIDKRFAKDAKYIRYTVLSEEDFNYRLERKDKFVLDIVKNPANILALNKSKNNSKYLRK